MKVVYKKTILDEIVEAVRAAEQGGQEIDFIELTQTEFARLRRLSQGRTQPYCMKSSTFGYVCGVKVYIVPDEGKGVEF